jgi:hypothetical protein
LGRLAQLRQLWACSVSRGPAVALWAICIIRGPVTTTALPLCCVRHPIWWAGILYPALGVRSNWGVNTFLASLGAGCATGGGGVQRGDALGGKGGTGVGGHRLALGGRSCDLAAANSTLWCLNVVVCTWSKACAPHTVASGWRLKCTSVCARHRVRAEPCLHM